MPDDLRSRQLRAILFDLDGVLYNGERLIPGAADTVEWVRAHDIPHLFVTNTTSRPRSDIADKLIAFGIAVSLEQVLTPAIAASEWLRTREAGHLAVFVPAAALSEFSKFDQVAEGAESGADYVIIGDLGHGWDFRKLNRAFRLLHSNPTAALIALGMTRYWMAADGLTLDVAPFVVALEHASGRKALVFGKPAPAFFQSAAVRLGVPREQILMIGDDIRADVGGAQDAGLKAALVQTGKFRAEDLAGGIRPDVLLDSVAALPLWWNHAVLTAEG